MEQTITQLREELINYFCHLLPKNVSITYDEKEIDKIIQEHFVSIPVEKPVKPEIAGIDKGLVTNLVGEIENDWQMGGFGGTIYEDFARELLYRYLKEKQFSV